MSAILRQNFPQSLLPFVGDWIGQDYKSKDTLYNKIFKVFNMDHAYHTDFMNYGAGVLRQVGENQPFDFDTMAQTWKYTYEALQYMTGFLISYRAMKDDKYLDLAKLRSKETRIAMDATREVLASYVINNAFNSSVTYGDGKTLISADHPIGIGPNQSNRPTNYVDFSEAAIEQANVDIAAIRNERGIRMQLKIKSLLIPQELEFEAHRVLKSDLRVDTPNNDTNAVKDLKIVPTIHVWNYLTDSDAWFLLLENEFGLRYGVREKPVFDSDNDFLTKAARFSVMMNECAGASDTLRSIYGSQGF